MSSDIAVRAQHLTKSYQIYERPGDRLKQFFFSPLGRHLRRWQRSYFKEFQALQDVSFEIRVGETVGIIGRNGSGKSTLLQIICGTLNPTAGSVHSNGKIAALLELGSGFNGDFTGRENVYLNASVLGLSRKQIDARFDDIAAFADIGEFIEQPVKTYSSGMFVRLAFAVIAHVDANILIIDEALAVGDALFNQKCMRFLHRFRESGTLLFVSHDAAAVTGLCDRAIWLERGRLRQQGRAKTVSEAYLAFLYEQSDVPAVAVNAQAMAAPAAEPIASAPDFRQAEIDRSVLRNDLQVFRFEPGQSADFGLRGAQITNVVLLDAHGVALSYITGGEFVELLIVVTAIATVVNPIVGFSFKDRLGQVLFGDNTYLSHCQSDLRMQPRTVLQARFAFRMPILPPGDYSVSAAVASGTQVDHVQHHWLHDALMLKSISSSVSTGLIGIPIHNIKIDVAPVA